MKQLTTKWNTSIIADISVYPAEGSVETTHVNKDDILDLGYIDNETLKEYTGRVEGFITNLKKTPTLGNTTSPVDTIKSDIDITGIILDCSGKYASNVITLNAKEIVESSGITGIVKVTVTPNIKASVSVLSTNDEETSEETLDDIMVGTEIPTISFKLPDGKKKTISATVVKFMYKEDSEKIKITSMILKDEENKIYNVAFKDIISLNEESKEPEDSGQVTPPDGPSGEDDF